MTATRRLHTSKRSASSPQWRRRWQIAPTKRRANAERSGEPAGSTVGTGGCRERLWDVFEVNQQILMLLMTIYKLLMPHPGACKNGVHVCFRSQDTNLTFSLQRVCHVGTPIHPPSAQTLQKVAPEPVTPSGGAFGVVTGDRAGCRGEPKVNSISDKKMTFLVLQSDRT